MDIKIVEMGVMKKIVVSSQLHKNLNKFHSFTWGPTYVYIYDNN